MTAANPRAKLILGHMPFIGVSYQSKDRDEEYRRRFSETSATKNIVEAAIKMGVRRIAAATPRSSHLSPVHLGALRFLLEEGSSFDVLPCIGIPIKLRKGSINALRRWATYVELESTLDSDIRQHIIADPILGLQEGWRHRLSTAKPYKEDDFRRLTVDWNQLDEDSEFFADFPVQYVELGSETDFLVMTRRFDILGELVDRMKNHGFRKVLLGIHHAGVTIPMLHSKLGSVHGYVTPLNRLGVMMFPTKLSAQNAVREAMKPVFAIKPMAGGRVAPKEAFAYVFAYDIAGCMFGVGSVTELKEDITAAIEVIRH